MKKYIFFILIFFMLINTPSVLAVDSQVPEITIPIQTEDNRVEILQAYLEKYNSPISKHAVDFIEAADFYQMDWRLLPAITGVESTFGKRIPGGHSPQTTSYNGWGWGVYGNNVKGFKSWREGIFTVSEGLKKNYINKGRTNPFTIGRIYAASPTWGSKVTYFISDIEKFEKQYKTPKHKLIISKFDVLNLEPRVTGVSAARTSK